MLETSDFGYGMALATAFSALFYSYGASSVTKSMEGWGLATTTGVCVSSRLDCGRRGQHMSVVINGTASIAIPILAESCISV